MGAQIRVRKGELIAHAWRRFLRKQREENFGKPPKDPRHDREPRRRRGKKKKKA